MYVRPFLAKLRVGINFIFFISTIWKSGICKKLQSSVTDNKLKTILKH